MKEIIHSFQNLLKPKILNPTISVFLSIVQGEFFT